MFCMSERIVPLLTGLLSRLYWDKENSKASRSVFIDRSIGLKYNCDWLLNLKKEA